MKQEHYLLGEVARVIGRKPFQITYMLTNGFIEEPTLRIGGRRIFNREDIEVIRKIMDEKFAVKEMKK